MSVAPLSSRPTTTRPRGLHTSHIRRRDAATGPAGPPALTVTFEVTLAGDSRYSDALEVLDTLRRVTNRLASADVRVTDRRASADVQTDTIPIDVGAGDEPPATVRIDVGSRSVHSGGTPVSLTRVEFDLLLFLAEHPRRVFTRVQLLQSVWGYAHAGQRTVDVHVRRLRAKLGDVPLVTTIRGVGYRLADDADLHLITTQRAELSTPLVGNASHPVDHRAADGVG